MNEDVESPIKYSDSVILYLDILGFRKIVENAGTDAQKIRDVYEKLITAKSVLDTVRESGEESFLNKEKTQINMFSDTVLITYPEISDKTIFGLSRVAAAMQWALFSMPGTFLRGAITVGNHYHKNDVMFGPSLIKAYDLERNSAEWPRIIIDPAVVDKLSITGRLMMLDYCFCRDTAGILFIDYLKVVWYHYLYESKNLTVDSTKYRELQDGIFKDHSQIILNMLKTSDVKSDFEMQTRYHAMATYHNECIDRICNDTLMHKELSQEIVGEIRAKLPKYKIKMSEVFGLLYSIQ
jgi:hypothetical protein